jgi:RNA polymerase sigma factor (TIGR02999 family)
MHTVEPTPTFPNNARIADLCAALYPDLRRLAHARLRGDSSLTQLNTTALVHESFLRLVKLDQLHMDDRILFLAYASRVMRSIVIDFIRAKKSTRRGGELAFVTWSTEVDNVAPQTEDGVLRINDALDALAETDPRPVQVVEMRYFMGMSEAEIASALGVTDRTVRRDWDKARIYLKLALG